MGVENSFYPLPAIKDISFSSLASLFQVRFLSRLFYLGETALEVLNLAIIDLARKQGQVRVRQIHGSETGQHR